MTISATRRGGVWAPEPRGCRCCHLRQRRTAGSVPPREGQYPAASGAPSRHRRSHRNPVALAAVPVVVVVVAAAPVEAAAALDKDVVVVVAADADDDAAADVVAADDDDVAEVPADIVRDGASGSDDDGTVPCLGRDPEPEPEPEPEP